MHTLVTLAVALILTACSAPSVLDRADVCSAAGAPDATSMARYEAWHTAQGLRLQRCAIHGHTQTSICHSVTMACASTCATAECLAACPVRRHICNGHYTCRALP